MTKEKQHFWHALHMVDEEKQSEGFNFESFKLAASKFRKIWYNEWATVDGPQKIGHLLAQRFSALTATVN